MVRLDFMLQNKKQRMMVRMAVLKGKDPRLLLEEMENIDLMGKYFYVIITKFTHYCIYPFL